VRCVVTPIGRPAYTVALKSEPTWGTDSGIGLGPASIDALLTRWERERFVFADVKLSGRWGLCWHGFGWRSPVTGAYELQGMGGAIGLSAFASGATYSAHVHDAIDAIHALVTAENPWALPECAANLAWVTQDTSAVAALARTAGQNAADFLSSTLAISDYAYGWYGEPTVGRAVPHFGPMPTTAAYVVDVREADNYDLNLRDASAMNSKIGVLYNGGASYLDVTAGTSPYLAELGVTKTRVVSADTTDAGDAARVGASAAAASCATVTGQIATRFVRDAHGAPFPCSQVRSDQLVTVLGLTEGAVTVPIVSTRHVGETSVSLTLDAHSRRLDVLLARLSAASRVSTG
jgi:hypothetical protein